MTAGRALARAGLVIAALLAAASSCHDRAPAVVAPTSPLLPRAVDVARRPNLVLVTIDALRPDVGFMGYPLPTTPSLDALASRSIVFDRAYALASDVGRSLAPMLIGKYPSETARDDAHYPRYEPENVFVAERFHAAGVRTIGASARSYVSAKFGLTQGFDVWDGSAVPAEPNDDALASVATSPALTDAAIGLLSSPANVEGPFFAWFHYSDPNAEYVPHPEAPRFAIPGGIEARLRSAYDAEIWFTDAHIGRLLDFIARQPWADRTAIVITSEHGEALGEHGMLQHGVEVWEELVRVPLVVYLPGAKPHHAATKRSLVDLAPTLLDLMGLALPAIGELSGKSLLPDLRSSPTGAAVEERDVRIDLPAGPFNRRRRALVRGPRAGLKLIVGASPGPRYQLYDLDADPGESRDLSANRSLLAPMIEASEERR